MGFRLNELCKENRAVWRRPLMMYAELFSMNHFEMESSSLLSCIYWRNKSFPFFSVFLPFLYLYLPIKRPGDGILTTDGQQPKCYNGSIIVLLFFISPPPSFGHEMFGSFFLINAEHCLSHVWYLAKSVFFIFRYSRAKTKTKEKPHAG